MTTDNTIIAQRYRKWLTDFQSNKAIWAALKVISLLEILRGFSNKKFLFRAEETFIEGKAIRGAWRSSLLPAWIRSRGILCSPLWRPEHDTCNHKLYLKKRLWWMPINSMPALLSLSAVFKTWWRQIQLWEPSSHQRYRQNPANCQGNRHIWAALNESLSLSILEIVGVFSTEKVLFPPGRSLAAEVDNRIMPMLPVWWEALSERGGSR